MFSCRTACVNYLHYRSDVRKPMFKRHKRRRSITKSDSVRSRSSSSSLESTRNSSKSNTPPGHPHNPGFKLSPGEA